MSPSNEDRIIASGRPTNALFPAMFAAVLVAVLTLVRYCNATACTDCVAACPAAFA